MGKPDLGSSSGTPLIPVTKPFLPDLRKYERYVDGIFGRGQLTNNGPLVRELTDRLEAYLGVSNLLLVANGTLALQVAFRALDLSGSVITSPFSFAATASSLLWERLHPIFGDVDPETLQLDPGTISGAVRRDTSAILPVHVYGAPCDVSSIERLARSRGLKVVYDAAHAFGVRIHGNSVLRHGDASILSFHATKLFHTAEGGAIVLRERAAYERAELMINFGLPVGEDGRVREIGINAKMSELHAAMGLSMLDDMDRVIEERVALVHLYRSLLADHVELLPLPAEATCNGAYMPILLAGSEQRDQIATKLGAKGIGTRRYFWPSLDRAYAAPDGPAIDSRSSEAAGRVLALPLFYGLGADDVRFISSTVIEAL